MAARVVGIALVLVVVLAGFGAWSLHSSYEKSRQGALSNTERTARFSSLLADGLVASSYRQLETVGATPAFVAGDVEAIREYVTRVNPASLGLSGGLGWVDDTGTLRYSSTPGSEGTDLSDRAYVQAGLRGERFVSEALVARKSKALLLVFSVPTRAADGTVNGVLAGSLALEDIGEAELQRLFGTDTVAAYDRDGKQIFGTDPSELGTPVDPSFWERVRGHEEGVVDGARGPSGRDDQVVGFARVAGPDWLFTVEGPRSQVMGAAYRQYRDSLLFLGLLALASLAGAGWLAVRLGIFHRAVAERQAQLQTVLQQLPAGVVVVDTDGEVVIANERAADTLRTRPAPHADDHGDITDVPEDEDELWPVMTAVGSRQPVDAELTVDRADGTHVLLVRSSPIFDGARLVGAAGVFEDVTRRRSRERERRALTEVTARLASAATPAEIGAVVVGPGADAMGASAAMLQVRDRTEPDHLVLLALRGYPEEVRDEWGSARVTDDSLAAEVVRSGEPRVGGTAHPNGDHGIAGVPPADLGGSGRDPHPGWAAFPLQSAGRVVGVLTLGFDAGTDDLSTPRVAGFAAQVGQALDRAVRQEVEHDVALALQRSMLSPLDDAGPDIRIACRYRPAQDHLVVGGDFFDAIALPDGSALLAIGDIVGHGLDAAAAMGQLRSATRALALSSPSPESVLAHLDAFVERVPACRYASAALVHLDPSARCITYSTAGHPPPLLRTPDGGVVRLDGAIGPPLGFAPARPRPLATLELPTGATTVCIYTDGLVERRDAAIDDHIDGLASVMADPSIAHASVDVVADHVLAVVGDETPQRDDIALIFAEIHVT